MTSQKRKALMIHICFWILVGITSGILYDLEWFIQHVVLFNGHLTKAIAEGTITFNDNGTLKTVDSINQFYVLFQEGGHQNVIDFYDDKIALAMKNEGLIFSAGIIIAAFISGPAVTWGINRKKNYAIFIIPILLAFAFGIVVIAPITSSIVLLATIFTPLFGFGYSYRTAIDPWATTFARKSRIRISSVRIFYELGMGLIALTITQIYFHYQFYEKVSGYNSGIAFYIAGAFLCLLALFIFLFLPNKQMFENKNDNNAKNATKNNGHVLKNLIFSRQFIVGTIIFMFLIGTMQTFGSVWVNTTENISSTDLGSVKHIGYIKIFSVFPRFSIAFIIFQLFNKKISFKTLMIIAAATATISWFLIGSLVYIFDDVPMLATDAIGGIAESCTATFAVLLGYEWVSRLTTVRNRNMTFVIFNTLTYGVAGILFMQINSFLSRISLFNYQGLLVWYIFGFATLVALILILFLFKNTKKTSSEYDETIIEHTKFSEMIHHEDLK